MIRVLPITVCMTHFKSLALANFEAALYSLRQQDMTHVESIVIVDNNSDDALIDLLACVKGMDFEVPVNLHSFKHDDPNKTHPWSTNFAVGRAVTPWIFFTRADYLLDFNTIARFVEHASLQAQDWTGWNGFVTANVCHLHVDVGAVGKTDWKALGSLALRRLPGSEAAYTCIDAGVWMARRAAFNAVHGLDESLPAWGHAQTHFQYKLHEAGVQFVRVPESLFYHPLHAAERDITVAHRQLRDAGIDLKALWARYEGAQVY